MRRATPSVVLACALLANALPASAQPAEAETQPPADAEAPAADAAAESEPAAESVPPEQIEAVAARLIEELREEQRRLQAREQELDGRERAIADLEAEALRLLEEVAGLQVAVEERIAEWESHSGDHIGRIAKVYGAMPPGRAAPLLEGLELDLATRIVTRMKHKKSAQVLALMSEDAALRVSRRAARPLLAEPDRAKKEETP